MAAGEAALRVVGWSKPHFYRPDPDRGWALAPGARGLYTDEGRGWVEVNRFGFRGPAPRVEKPPGTYRIALLGDSQAEALQVDFADTFGEVLERRLAECPALAAGAALGSDAVQRVEVLNFGVSGYGTAQALLTLRHAAAAFEPDLVLLALYTGNDVRNNLEEIERDPGRPYFRLADEGELVLDDSFRDSPGFRRRDSSAGRAAYAALDRSRLAQAAKAFWSARRDRRAAAEAEARATEQAGAGERSGAAEHPEAAEHPDAAEPLAELGLDNAVYRPPGDAAADPWHRAWEVTEALILALDREAAARGAELAVVTLSNGIQVHPNAATRQRFAARLGVDDLTYPDRRLTAFARGHGIPALPLVFPLRRLAEEQDLALHGFEPAPDAAAADAAGPDVARWNRGHWNRQGHRAAGSLLARWLCALGLPGTRLAPDPRDPGQ